MQKVRYEIDPYNRLVINKAPQDIGLTKFRKVIDGEFKTDENNNLSYHIKAPVLESENIPHQIKLKGSWSLTDNHDLRLSMDKLGRETFGDEVTLQGEIIDAGEDFLLFAITTKRKENQQSTYVLNLNGSWKADENNRLSFDIKKEEGRHDILTFNGAWQVNDNHQIIYQYEKALLIRKRKKINTLAFKGYWDIKDRLRISYILGENTESAFDFKASAGIFKGDYIKYELGIGLTNRTKPIKQTITLFGKWAIKKGVGLIFEVEYENKKTHRIVFGADARLTGKDTISFKLKNYIEHKDIGINMEISRRILKGDGEAFLRFLKSKGESAVYIGAGWGW